MIEKLATEIVQTLFDAGYTAYFAGGFVRDLLLGLPSQEIDIATSAPPEKIMALFPKTIAVGVAFGVVIVVIEGHSFEVTTFRKDHPYHDGRHPEGVDYSTAEHDALRRDFTINGMFYDPLNKQLHDYVEGQKDLKLGIIRAIGNPEERFQEDRLRMIRAVRFSARFNFPIETHTEDAIVKHASTLLPAVSIERIVQELTKMSQHKSFASALSTLHRLQLLHSIFPDLKSDLHATLEPFPYFPLNTPLIAYLLELFPGLSLEARSDLCYKLKLTKQDIQLAEFFYHAEKLFTQPTAEKFDWAHFYAHPHSSLFIEIQKAKLPLSQKEKFTLEHETRKQELQEAIQRIQNRTPLITAAHLQQLGIIPSKKMGVLLKEAERLSINENLNADQTLKRLQKSTLWNL